MKALASCIVLLTVMIVFSGQQITQPGSTKVSKIIQETENRFSISIIYKSSDIKDVNDNEYEISGNFTELNKNEILTLLSKSCGLEIEKLNDTTYLMKPRTGRLEDRLAGQSRLIDKIQAELSEIDEVLNELSSISKSQQKSIKELQDDIRSIESDLLLIQSRI